MFRIAEHEHGQFLLLQSAGICAMDMAVNLLGFLESEFEAEIEDSGWKRGHGPGVAEPVLIQLEGLGVELSTDGNEVVMRRVAGSKDEFEELCGHISGWGHRG